MADLLAKLSGFDAVMLVLATGAAGLVVYLVFAVQRLNVLRQMQDAGEVASILTQDEIDQMLGFEGKPQDQVTREDE